MVILLFFFIISGTLPTGFTLNSQTGMISGSSTTLQTNTTVTILIQNSLGEKSVNIEFSIVSYDTTCTSSEVLVTIARTTKSNSHQESFTIN